MLFKLSMKNIGKSIRDYAIYFFTLIVGVAVFYVFNAIETQTVMLDVTSSTREIIKLMVSMLSGVSVFVSIILAFLIVYASMFLMKRRKKEFGIYLTLGMGKRRISLILFFETLVIGAVSLVAGLLFGVGLSQVMSVFVANMFEADMTKFTFVFSISACRKTIVYFSIMYLVVMIFNTVVVSRCRLIELLQAGRCSEQVKMKNPWVCTIVFLVASGFLGYAYYMVTEKIMDMQRMEEILIPIAIGIVTTFLIFWSLSGLLLRIFMALRKTYFKGLNSFTLRQISSKINTTVCGMSIICLMLFVTICVLASCLSLRNSLAMQLDELCPVDVMINKVNQNTDEIEDDPNMDQAKFEEQQQMSIHDMYADAGIPVDTLLAESVSVQEYEDAAFTMRDSIGTAAQQMEREYPTLVWDAKEQIISLSDYNRLATLYGKKTFTLDDNEYIVVANFGSFVGIRDVGLQSGTAIRIFGHTLSPKYHTCEDGFIEPASNACNLGFFVVPDAVVKDQNACGEYLIGNYAAQTKEERYAADAQLIGPFDKTLADAHTKKIDMQYVAIRTGCRTEVCDSAIGLGAMVSFIGLYLGIIFLISAAAILALKELSESADNVERYQILRRLGADEKMIKHALFRQIGIFFLAPLILAAVHSIFGMKFAMILLESVGTSVAGISIVITLLVLAFIYGGYFVLTYVCSKNIIKERI